MGPAPASSYVAAESPQPFIYDSQVAHLLEEDQRKVAFSVASVVKTLRF